MEKNKNEIIKKLKSIENICLLGATMGAFIFIYDTKLDKENRAYYGITSISSAIGYMFSSGKRNKLEKEQKNYYYKN